MNTTCPRPDMLIVVDEDVLSDARAAEIRDHITGCAVCKQLQQDLRDSPLAEPTLEELTRVRKRVLVGAQPASRIFRYVAVSAAALLAVGGVYLVRHSEPQEPAVVAVSQPAPAYRLKLAPAPLRLPFAAVLLLRGKEESGNQKYLAELGDALKPYREAHYKEASEALAGLGERYPKAVEPLFYRGVSRLLLDDAAGALGLLEQARKIGGEALNDDILWYLAVARERTGNWSESSALLKALCSNEGANRADACSGLNPK